MKFTQGSLITGLKICAFLIFIGRAYQYLFFDAPFRAILWDESLLQPIVEGVFNVTWNDYVTSMTVDRWINRSIAINGFLFVIAGFASVLINKNNRKYLKFPILLGAWLLVILSILSAKDKFYHYGQFFEHAIQFGVPFVLVMITKAEMSIKRLSLVLKILIAVTFTSHGLYALGYYPIPGYFIDMTISTLNVNEDTAVLFLNIVGALDLVLAVMIFVPKLSKYFLVYAFIWGILTALARIVAFFNVDFITSSIHQTLYLVIYRLAHGFIPLLVLFTDIRLLRKENITHQIFPQNS